MRSRMLRRALTLAATLTTLRPAAAGSGLLDKRVVVTGGGRGIGRAIALLCAQEGAHVALLARSAAEIEAVAAEAAAADYAAMVTRPCDVTDSVAVDSAIASLAAEMGGIDLLVNNAGNSCSKGPLWEQSPSEFKSLLELNTVSVMTVSAAVLRHSMLKRGEGSIINISSRAGKMGIASMGPYVASKFAVEGLTATLAAELQTEHPGIRVNSISPGMVDTVAFPKKPGRPGVRSAASIREGFLHLLSSGRTGHYLHVDEYDAALAAGHPDAALKPIDEPTFEAGACAA